MLYAPSRFYFSPDTKITQNFRYSITPNDLQPLANIVQVYGAKGCIEIIYTIQQQYKKEIGVVLKSDAFRLGPRFIESVNERGLNTDKAVLNSFFRATAM